MKKILLLLGVAVLSSCASTSVRNHGTTARWYEGTVEEAKILAEKRRVPLFLYWGAKWCPPCNEIKAQVFQKERFAQLMELVVPVYLDGDTKQAQVWGEKFAIHGYPTMLVLGPRGKERLRISAFVNMEEFEKALQGALVTQSSFKELLDRAVSGKLSDEEWRLLAYFSWTTAKDVNLNANRTLKLRKKILDNIPSKLKVERSLLAASLLMAVTRPDAKKLSAHKDIQLSGKKYTDFIFSSEATIFANRGTILYSPRAIIEFVQPKKGKRRSQLEKRWLVASRWLGDQKNISNETRLWSIYPELQIAQMKNPKKGISDSLRKQVVSRVDEVNKRAESPFEREAIVSGAAFLLKQVDAYDKARELLKNEAESSKTPWYYQAALAGLEAEQDNAEKALYWSRLARRSAKGRATKLQWSVMDLQMSIQFEKQAKRGRIERLVEMVHEIAFRLEDGFSGRNLKYLEKAKKSLLPVLKKRKPIGSWLRDQAPRCESLLGTNKRHCQSYFKSFN